MESIRNILGDTKANEMQSICENSIYNTAKISKTDNMFSTLSGLRNELKKIGFGVRTKTLSFGRAATYYHIGSKKTLTYNCMSSDQLAFWQLLFDFRKCNKISLDIVRRSEGVSGLM